MAIRLQAFHIFKKEVTRLNQLYWTSSYCYAKTRAALGMLSSSGHEQENQRVDVLWPSKVKGEAKHTTVALSAFGAILDQNAEALRTTAVLHLCSAFETGLANYFALCALYDPGKVSRAPKHKGVPGCLASAPEFAAAKRWAVGRANSLVKTYSTRLSFFEKSFGLTFTLGSLPVELDRHYRKRDLVAHDQGLDHADAPDLSADEVLASRLRLTEEEWKKCIEDFLRTLEAVDDAVQVSVVKDRGLALAVYHLLPKMKPCTVGRLMHVVNTTRNLAESYSSVEAAAVALGHEVSANKIARKRIVT